MDIKPDVRADKYIGKCPGCGRLRLEIYVDGEDGRAVGVQCEKCNRQWLLDPDTADFYGDHDERDPLHPSRAGGNNPFEGSADGS